MPKKTNKKTIDWASIEDKFESLKKEVNSGILSAKVDLKASLLSLENRLDLNLENKLASLKNEMQKYFDKAIKELEIAREDRVFAIAKDRDQDQKLENLDKRVKVLEKSPA